MRLEIEDYYRCENGHIFYELLDDALRVRGASPGYLGCPECEKHAGMVFVEESFRFAIRG